MSIRIGIVGAGANTRSRHIPGLRAIDGVEIVGVCNRSRESSERAARDLGIPRTHADWRDLVESADIDAVVIGTWPYLHCPVTLAAIEAGKHVLCEARMAMNAAEARAMRDAARARPGIIAQVVPSPMTLGVDRAVQRMIAEGYLGRILAIEVRDTSGFLDLDAPLGWRQDADLSGNNVMTLGIWYEAIVRWVGEATSVVAMGRAFMSMRRAADGRLRAVRIPDHLDVVAEMACDSQAHFQISRALGLGGPSPEAWLYGTNGTLRFFDGGIFGGRRGDPDLEAIQMPAAEVGGWRVEEEFVGAIRGEEPVSRTTFDDGVRYLEFTDAVVRAMASGSRETVRAD